MNFKQLTFFALFSVAWLQAHPNRVLLQEGVDLEKCGALLAKYSEILASGEPTTQWGLLTEDQRSFVEQMLFPIVGQRAIAHGVDHPRKAIITKNSITWPGYPARRTGPAGKSIRVEWRTGIEIPFDVRGTSKTGGSAVPVHNLVLPLGNRFEMEPQAFRNLLMKWLVGHPLYPYIIEDDKRVLSERASLNETPIFNRPVQAEAIAVHHHYLDRFHAPGTNREAIAERRNFSRLIVASPTATGKTRILIAGLEYQIGTSPDSKGLYLTLGDRDSYVTDIEADVIEMGKRLAKVGKPIKIIRWGGGKTDKAEVKNIQELTCLVETSKVPVVLVTLIQSFKSRAGLRDDDKKNLVSHPNLLDDKFGALVPHMRGEYYDEVHNSGALEARALMQYFSDNNPRVFFFGITPVPDQKIQAIFNFHVFWGYIDRELAGFLKRKKELFSVQRIFRQLKIAGERFEILPIRQVIYMALKEEFGEDVFEKRSANGIDVLREMYYPVLFARIAPSVRTRKGYIRANTIEEARKLLDGFNKHFDTPEFGHRRAEIFVSEDVPSGSTKEASILRCFFGGHDPIKNPGEREIHVLITVKKLDAGINLFPATFYVELNPQPDPRSFINCLGRAARPFEDGQDIIVYLVSPDSEATLSTRRVELNALSKTKYVNPKTNPGLGSGVTTFQGDDEDDDDDDDDDDEATNVSGDTETDDFIADVEMPEERGILPVNADVFLTIAEGAHNRRLHFWDRSESNYLELSTEERQDFVAKIYPLLKTHFTGYVTNLLGFVDHLRTEIADPSLINEFDRQVKSLNLTNSTASGARAREAGNVDKLHALLQFYAAARPLLQLDARLTILTPEQLQKLFPDAPFGLNSKNYDRLRYEVYPALARCFANLHESMRKIFTERLLSEIPEEKRAEYLRLIAATKLHDYTGYQIFFRGEDIPILEKVLILYAQSQTRIPYRANQVMDGDWVKKLFARWYVYEMTPTEKATLKSRLAGGYSDFLAARIPRLTRDAKSGFANLAQFIPDPDRRQAYLLRLEDIGLKKGTIDTALKPNATSEPLYNWNAAMWAFADARRAQAPLVKNPERLIPMEELKSAFSAIGFDRMNYDQLTEFLDNVSPLIYDRIKKNAISNGTKEWIEKLLEQGSRLRGKAKTDFLLRMNYLATFSPRGFPPQELAHGALVIYADAFHPQSAEAVRQLDIDTIRTIIAKLY